jgi:hypothetical protein
MWVGDQRHASAALPPGKRPGTPCIQGWVGPRGGLEGCWKSHPHPDSVPGSYNRNQPVAVPTQLSLPRMCWEGGKEKLFFVED